MTVGVDDELRIREYPGDDSATPRAYGFKILDEDDLRVTRTNADGSETVLVRGTHYSVSGAGNPTGGNVTPLAPIATGTSWRIEGDMSLGQPTDYTAGDDFPAESHERGLDRSMIAHQEARRDIENMGARSWLVPRGEAGGVLPPAAARAGKFRGWGATGEEVQLSGTGNDAALRTDLADEDAGGLLVAAKDALNTVINLAMAIPKRAAFASHNAIASSAVIGQAAALQAFVSACALAGVTAVIDQPAVALEAPVELIEGASVHINRGCWIRSLIGVAASDRFLFDVKGDNVSVSVEPGYFGGFDPAAQDRRIWSVRVRGFYSNVTLTNVWCYDQSRVYCDTSAAAIEDVEFEVNTPTNVRVIGGGVVFRGDPLTGAQTSAVDHFGFCDGFADIGGWFHNCPAFIQWWGDDAAGAGGADGLPRWCRNGLIANFQGNICVGAGVWGSMGHNIRLVSGTVRNVGDVGIDFEGCTHSSATGVTSIDAVNGAFATFFINDGIDFEACHGISTNAAYPLYATSNVAQSLNNRNISFKGGSYKGVGVIALFGHTDGPCRNWTVKGVTFANALIDLNANNNVEGIFCDNMLRWDIAAPGTRPILVDLGAHANTPGDDAKGPKIVARGNSLRSWVAQPAETVGLRLSVAGENVDGKGLLAANDIDGIPIPAIFESFNGNATIANRCVARGNTFDVALLGKTQSDFTAVAGADVVTHLFPRLETGSRLSLTNAGGALPATSGGAMPATVYWIRISQFTGKFATSEATALAGTAIDITDTGTGTHTMVMGANVGSLTTVTNDNLTFAGAAIA